MKIALTAPHPDPDAHPNQSSSVGANRWFFLLPPWLPPVDHDIHQQSLQSRAIALCFVVEF